AIPVKRGDPIPMRFPETVTPDELRKHLEIPPGAPLPANQNTIEKELRKIRGVVAAQLSAICCEPDGTTTLFVGIEESTNTTFAYRKLKTTDALLSPEVLHAYEAFTEALGAAVQAGTVGEDDSEGHALFQAESLKPFQNDFIATAAREGTNLQHVLLT